MLYYPPGAPRVIPGRWYPHLYNALLNLLAEPRDCNLLKFRDMCAPRPTQRNTRPCISAKPSALTTSYSVRAKEGFQYWYHERPKPTSCKYSTTRGTFDSYTSWCDTCLFINISFTQVPDYFRVSYVLSNVFSCRLAAIMKA